MELIKHRLFMQGYSSSDRLDNGMTAKYVYMGQETVLQSIASHNLHIVPKMSARAIQLTVCLSVSVAAADLIKALCASYHPI